MAKKVRLSGRLTRVSDDQIHRMAEIVANYFPDPTLMEQTIRSHLAEAGTIRLAYHDDIITGFAIASRYTMQTPFYPRPTAVIYQRMLYLDPAWIYRGAGFKLLGASMRDLFGWLWPLRRLVAICRTQNPVVARIMGLYDLSYPRFGERIPAEVRRFAEGLLPMLGARALDEDFRLVGTLDRFEGADYTDIWNRYLHRRNNAYESLMLHSAFAQQGDRIINSGAFVLMLGYARPMRFLRYLLH
jgi:hypothetical protein